MNLDELKKKKEKKKKKNQPFLEIEI